MAFFREFFIILKCLEIIVGVHFNFIISCKNNRPKFLRFIINIFKNIKYSKPVFCGMQSSDFNILINHDYTSYYVGSL